MVMSKDRLVGERLSVGGAIADDAHVQFNVLSDVNCIYEKQRYPPPPKSGFPVHQRLQQLPSEPLLAHDCFSYKWH